MVEIYCCATATRRLVLLEEFLLQYFGHVRMQCYYRSKTIDAIAPNQMRPTTDKEKKIALHLHRRDGDRVWESIVFVTVADSTSNVALLHSHSLTHTLRLSVAHLDIRQVQINKLCSVSERRNDKNSKWIDDDSWSRHFGVDTKIVDTISWRRQSCKALWMHKNRKCN